MSNGSGLEYGADRIRIHTTTANEDEKNLLVYDKTDIHKPVIGGFPVLYCSLVFALQRKSSRICVTHLLNQQMKDTLHLH